MSTYRFGKAVTWDKYHYFYIDRKTLFGWKECKTWHLSLCGAHSHEYEKKQRKEMMSSVERLVKAGHTVL